MVKHNSNVYCVFVRNHSKQGTFIALQKDLGRLKKLNIDTLFLLPIHEIGEENRRGTCGSPFAVRDYYSIDKSYGTLEDFKKLVGSAHRLGMKVVLEMVFNHTSTDSILVQTNPNFYLYKNDHRYHRFEESDDVVDLDTSKKEVQDYLIKVLTFWLSLGVDGFSFDQITLLPLDFIKRIRKVIGKKTIIIGKNIKTSLKAKISNSKVNIINSNDLFPTIDVLFDHAWTDVLQHVIETNDYMSVVKFMVETNTNDNALFVNYYQKTKLFSNIRQKQSLHEELLDFIFFLKGWTFTYMGEEIGKYGQFNFDDKKPIDWSQRDINTQTLYEKLLSYKASSFNANIEKQKFEILKNGQIAVIHVNKKGVSQVKTFRFDK